MKWTWRLPAEPGRTLTLDVNYWTGAKHVSIDGTRVPTPNKLIGWSHTFPVGTQQATLRVKLKYLLVPEAVLEIAGVAQQPLEAPPPVPAWALAFVAANLAILVVARGGALPGAIAGIGAALSVAVTRTRLSVVARLGLAASATAAAWGAVAALMHAAHR